MYTTSIKDFKKEKVLGKGSFGSVYLVRRKQDNKIYALKTVIMEKLNKREQENSVNEVRILASVNHPNVIGYKEAFWDDTGSSLNIVMEYADDGDLHSKIEKMKKAGGFFKEPIIWSYAIQMIEGLKALHDKKIMHRDLKSANIFLFKKNNICKIGDMNVSKAIKDKVLLTQTGTPYYASPEVWRDESYSYKSDLWSIGCVIYELCEQHPPFMGKNLDELFEDVCKGKPKRINNIYSEELWKVIMMLLQTDAEKRADCDSFLNSKIIKDKINEIKLNKKINGNIKNKSSNDILLNTIKFNNLKDLKYQLPSTKNYDCQINDNNKENVNTNNINNKINNYIKNSLIKKIPIVKNKTSRNRLNLKTEDNNNKEKKRNHLLLEKIKEIQITKDISKYRLNIQKQKKLILIKNRSKKEIKTELNIDSNIPINNPINKLMYNKSEVFDKNKHLVNKTKIKRKTNSKENLKINTQKNKLNMNKLIPFNIANIITPSLKLSKEKNNKKINNCLHLDMSNDISKQINCITQTSKHNNNINLIPICKQRNKKEHIKKKINTKLIKRRNTYTKDGKKEIKIKEIALLPIKRNKSLNLETFKNIKSNKHKHRKNNLSLNSLNLNNNIYYYRKYNIINNTETNKNGIKKRFYHQRYPTISFVQYAILNNINNYKIISANLRNKKGSNHKTLSSHLHKNIKSLTKNNKNKIQSKKIKLNLNNNERRINSFVNITEKTVNNSDVIDNVTYDQKRIYSLKMNNNSNTNKDNL